MFLFVFILGMFWLIIIIIVIMLIPYIHLTYFSNKYVNDSSLVKQQDTCQYVGWLFFEQSGNAIYNIIDITYLLMKTLSDYFNAP